MKNAEPTKGEKIIGFFSLWVARLCLTVLAFAGGAYFLGGVDPIIKYAFDGVVVAFLLKETI